MTGNTNEKRKLAYICAPYAGDVEKNKKTAIDFGKMAHEKGFLPIIPHLLFPYLDDEKDRDEAMSTKKHYGDRELGLAGACFLRVCATSEKQFEPGSGIHRKRQRKKLIEHTK